MTGCCRPLAYSWRVWLQCDGQRICAGDLLRGAPYQATTREFGLKLCTPGPLPGAHIGVTQQTLIDIGAYRDIGRRKRQRYGMLSSGVVAPIRLRISPPRFQATPKHR